MSHQARQHLLSLTRKDFRWDTYRGSGAGGQHRNTTDSAVRCTHEPSGCVGTAQDERSQHRNRRLAFLRCVRQKKFQVWLKLESQRKYGEKLSIEMEVERQLQNVVVEHRENGKWVRDTST